MQQIKCNAPSSSQQLANEKTSHNATRQKGIVCVAEERGTQRTSNRHCSVRFVGTVANLL